MTKLKLKKNGFTLAETLIVCSMFAFVVIGIIFAINKAFAFLDNTRLLVRATNFAREGVEMVYNIRDTNRKKYSGERDKHRLDTGTGNSKIGSGTYLIKEQRNSTNGDSHLYVERLDMSIDAYNGIENFFSIANENNRGKSEIIFTGSYSYFSGGTLYTGNMSDLLQVDGLKFYRVLRVYGIYCKNNSEPNKMDVCPNDTDPKEMRFCVKVFYDANGGKHATELCSIMTNFEE